MPIPGNVKLAMVNEGGSGSVSDSSSRSLVVVLIGPPASGKSTFCHKVIEGARRPWIRICQDVISSGKPGSKSQCLKQASQALNEGQNVIIDRCNLMKEQRHEFVQLAGLQTEVHTVVLDLPAKLCISRVAKRTAHEGGLQGGKAAAVINKMLQTKEEPILTEGFSRIMYCQTEADVDNAINMYNRLGPSDSLPSGIHGKKCRDDKCQTGMLRFFKKDMGPQNSDTDTKCTDQLKDKQMMHKIFENSEAEKCNEIISCAKPLDRRSTESIDVQSYGCSSSGVHENDCIPTLAFPSIATSDFKFDHEKAANIIAEEVFEFLKRHRTSNFRLVFVDLTQDSDMLRRVRSKAAEKGLDSERFLTIVGDITKLYSKGGLKCNVIANAANWRLKAVGGGVNSAIFKAVGPELEAATKQRAKTLSPGSALVVPLPTGCSFSKHEGVTHVIHVLGPNMNPQRPNFLGGDYAKGCKVLHDAYSSLFASFLTIFKAQETPFSNQHISESKSRENEVQVVNSGQAKETKISGTRDVFTMLMQSSKSNNSCVSDKKLKRKDSSNPELNKRCKLDAPDYLPTSNEHAFKDDTVGYNLISSSRPGYEIGPGSTATHKDQTINHNTGKTHKGKRPWEAWAQALHDTAFHPEQNRSILELTDSVVVLPDLYPKAKRHVLVVARLDGLDSLADVRKEHLSLLREIHSMGEKLVASFLQEDPMLIFRLGYHSVPSMRQLHLHVISQDFDSLHLKNKKHWNSFTTNFFRDSVDVLEQVDKFGKAEISSDKDILSMELRCHRCRSAHPNIPRLKSHISNCKAPFPAIFSWGGHLFSSSQVKDEQLQ